jgi:hypothetical protein
MAYDVGNPGPGLRHAQKCGGLSWLMGSELSHLNVCNGKKVRYIFINIFHG